MKARVFLLVAALFAALSITGCDKEKDEPIVDNTSNIVGEWHCVVEAYDAEVYVTFYAEGTFDEYQRLGEGRYRHYAGTWSVEKDILSGIYADGTEWGSQYQVSFADGTMTLTAINDSQEATTYTKEAIPAKVRDSAIEPFASRSEDDDRWF